MIANNPQELRFPGTGLPPAPEYDEVEITSPVELSVAQTAQADPGGDQAP